MPEPDAPVPPFPTYTRTPADDPAGLAGAEWVLTSGLGGFAMGTARGTPTRRYHGLLIASLTPPVQREMLLHSLVETVVLDSGGPGERRVDLSSYRFRDGVRHPRGDELLVEFQKGASCRWVYRVGGVEVAKMLHLFRGANAAAVRYTVRGAAEGVRLELRPLAAMRDAHGLLSKDAAGEFRAEGEGRRARVRRGWGEWERVLELESDAGSFRFDPQWWYGFEYEHELDRGYDAHEDLFSPGVFVAEASVGSGLEVGITAFIGQQPTIGVDEDERRRGRRVGELAGAVLRSIPDAPAADRGAVARLVAAADDFVVQRGAIGSAGAGVSIIAGYPWFSDWGRDSMISLPGLLLATVRHEEARKVLATFAAARRRGLIPNLFNDWSGHAEYNTVDGSLWFLHAACEYLRISGDRAGFQAGLKEACLDIIAAYRGGTDFGIGMDRADGLIAAGDENSQLTWMDAKRDGIVFTPRQGKAVEINALWHHGLLSVAAAVGESDPARAAEFRALAAKVAESFRSRFWNAPAGCCVDVLLRGTDGGWTPDARIRPNQLLAVSLAHSPLTRPQQRSVVERVKRTLLTPVGLRTLDPADPGYRPTYRGPMRERDAAYHNGTVWPWLLGPYAEAVLRAGQFSAAARAEALAALRPLVAEMDRHALGQIAEVYDGDDSPERPRGPGGCPAQAWSVAEPLRVMLMALRGERG